MFLKSKAQKICFAPIDLKLANIYVRDGFGNGTNTPTTSAIEDIGETEIALQNMNTAVPDPAVSTGVSVKFGSDTTEYTVTVRTLGSGTNEVQSIEIDDNLGGTFTLTFGGYTTGAIAFNASTAVVQAALQALTSIGLGNVTVSGAAPIWIVTFAGTLASTDVALLTGDGTNLTGGETTDVDVAETVAGVAAVDEIQESEATVALTAGVYTITLLGETTQNISFDATAIEVEMALESLDGVAVGEASVVDSGTWPALNETLTVTFSGNLAGTNIALMTIGSGGLTGTIVVTASPEGVAGVIEVQTVRINDSVTGGTFTLTHDANESVPILYNANAAAIEAALEGLASISAVTVTAGPGPATDWIVTWTVTGVQLPITGDGTNLTGGDVDAVIITETTKGVTATGTTLITVTPVLVAATTIGGSVTFGGRKLEVKVGEGNLTYTENEPREYLKNRGLLDTVRNADEEPMDVSFDFTWEFLSAVGSSAIPTLKEALKQQGEASTWVSTSDDLCEPYCINLEIHYDPACGGANTELIELKEFRQETLEHNLSDAQISCTGKCNVVEAVETRGA